MTRHVLLVEDDRDVRDALSQTLELAGCRPLPAGSFVAAKDWITRDFDGVVVSDLRMPGRDGFHLLGYAKRVDPDLPVILLTGQGDVPAAVRGMAEGAFDFLEKPCATREFVAVVEKALETRAVVLGDRRVRRAAQSGDAAARMIFGESAAVDALRAHVRAAARTSAEVLVSGAPGSGTSKIAEVIHLLSGAAQRPFLKLAAASVDAAELARSFDAARGGTVFLNEIAELSSGAQFAAIDLIEANEGCRVIAGTYTDLAREAQAGRFNPDLFYKLDLMRVRIPSLAERPEDIPVLFRRYVAQACEQAGLRPPEITDDVLAGLMSQDWPGNAHALMNAAMRFAMGLPETAPAGELGLAAQMARVERSLLIRALQRHRGNATETARSLQLPRKTLYDKLTRHGVKPEEYREAGMSENPHTL